MRSRMILAAAAWLLGALTAMGGSFLAVNGIAHGLLGTGAQHVVVAPIQGIPAADQAASSLSAAPLSGALAGDDGDQDSASKPLPPAVTATPQTTSRASPQATPSGGSPPGGSLVVSPGGTVMASCQSGLAYLQYWSPSPGYQADDVIRGPAARASIGFEHLPSEYAISVTCNGSTPVANVTGG